MELLQELEIDFRLMAVHAAAFVIVLLVLRRFFFRPFGHFLEVREQRVHEEQSEAQQARRQAQEELEQLRRERSELWEQVSREAAQELREAREQSRRLLEEAREAARRHREHADEQARRLLEVERAELMAQVGDLATEIARKAVLRALGAQDREASVETAVRHIEQLRKLEEVAPPRGERRQALVETSRELEPDQTSRLQSALERLLGGPVRLEQQVAPELLGGLRVKIDSQVLDVSVQGTLERIERALGQESEPGPGSSRMSNRGE